MCSNPEPSPAGVAGLEDIERAIDELAALAMAAYASDVPGKARGAGRAADGDERLVARLAEIWTWLADLDPEVARRVPVYQASRLAAVPDPRQDVAPGLLGG